MAGVSSDRNGFIHESVFGNTDFETKFNAPNTMIGLNASISSRRNLNRNSVLLETYITRERVKYESHNFSVNIHYLTISPRFRHQFISMRKINPFLGGGLNAKYLINYPTAVQKYGVKLNFFLVGEAGLRFNNFLLSANAKLLAFNTRPYMREDLLIIYHDGTDTITETIIPQKVSFHVSLTYLLYNSGRKGK
jgi:hypothetical protein